jgi:hypothetical protein
MISYAQWSSCTALIDPLSALPSPRERRGEVGMAAKLRSRYHHGQALS